MTLEMNPLEEILNWYNSQDDKKIKMEFTNLTSYFHPDHDIENETNPEKRKEKFEKYLSLSEKERREIVRRSLSVSALIDLVIEIKGKDEESLGVLDATNFRWVKWFDEWNQLRSVSLSNREIANWFFN